MRPARLVQLLSDLDHAIWASTPCMGWRDGWAAASAWSEGHPLQQQPRRGGGGGGAAHVQWPAGGQRRAAWGIPRSNSAAPTPIRWGRGPKLTLAAGSMVRGQRPTRTPVCGPTATLCGRNWRECKGGVPLWGAWNRGSGHLAFPRLPGHSAPLRWLILAIDGRSAVRRGRGDQLPAQLHQAEAGGQPPPTGHLNLAAYHRPLTTHATSPPRGQGTRNGCLVHFTS